jgi:hypothetical protein
LSPLLFNIALAVLDEHMTAPWTEGGNMSTQYKRRARRRNGLPNWRYVRYADLCRARHKSAYAEHRIMPSRPGDCLVRAVGGSCCRHNPPDVHAAQPEPGDQQNDRVVPLPARVVPVDRLRDPGYLAGIPYRRDPGLPGRACRRDRPQAAGIDQAFGGREPQERPHRAQFLLDRLDLVSGQRRDERPDRGRVTGGQPAAGASERDELPG